MRGYETILKYVGIFIKTMVWNFYEVFRLWESLCGTSCGGGFIWFPLHMTMVWYLARGAGILAPSDAITQTSISVDRRGWGFPAPLQGRRPEDIGHRADEQKPSFLAQARKTTSSER